MNERYSEISDDVISKFMQVYNSKSFSIKVGFKFVNDIKLKQVVQIKKLPDLYSYLLDKDVIVLINEDLYDKLESDESINILIEQELDKLSIDMNSGKIKMTKPDLVTFSSLMNKYGEEKILRANQLDDLSASQEADLETNFK